MKRIIAWLLIAAMCLTFAAFVAKNPLPEEGSYLIDVTLSGGTGKATIASPAQLVVFPDGKASLVVIWSSDKYDYMLVNGERYEPAISDGHSTFVIPVENIRKPLSVVADTVAMSTPHEIEYTITFDPASLAPVA